MKIDLFFQEITFKKEFPCSNFLLPSFLSGGKWDFQVANLLLATVNFEPRNYHFFLMLYFTAVRNSYEDQADACDDCKATETETDLRNSQR